VIAFLHANADAAALKSVVNTVSMRGYPFPDLQLNCAGVDKSLSELRGRPIHLVARSKAEDIARIRATDEKAGLQTVVAGDAPGENCQVAATDRGLVDWLYGPDFDPSWRYELFIDTGGLLRGLWWPDAARTEADQLSQAMSRLARPGISARQSGGHAH
jgi:hypothetical protein